MVKIQDAGFALQHLVRINPTVYLVLRVLVPGTGAIRPDEILYSLVESRVESTVESLQYSEYVYSY